MNAELRVDQATESLRAYLPARIAALNSDGGVQLVEPRSAPGVRPDEVGGDRYIAGGWPVLPDDWHPCVEVGLSDLRTFGMDLASLRGDSDYPIQVALHCHHTDYAVLWRTIYRYGLAVAQVLSRRDLIGSSATTEVRQRYELDVEEGDKPIYRATARLLAIVGVDDDLGHSS